MLLKLKRKVFNAQRLVAIVFGLFLFYLICMPNRFYASVDYVFEDTEALRNYLLSYISKLEFNDLNVDQNVYDREFVERFFIKNLAFEKKRSSIKYVKDLDNLFLIKSNLVDIKNANIKELNAEDFNLIKKNLDEYQTIDLLNLVIKIKNHQELITNLNQFKLGDFDSVIVVQVHNRILYLKLLIESLSKVKGIDKALLIFSHDLFDLEINRLVEDIKFCKVLQIFFPHSIQLNPYAFPGTDPYDCSRDISYVFAKLIQCNNADYQDTFGHYREAKFCQTKHHWWWKLNYIFDKLRSTKNYDGVLLTLEDDYYVLPDLLFILKLIHYENIKKNQTDQFISLGSYVKSLKQFVKYGNFLINRRFFAHKHNMGMALTRKLFDDKIKKYAKNFCNLDDYNWDWSLEHISKTCLDMPLRTTNLVLPRVLHIGKCGLHHKNKDCQNVTLINEFDALIKTSNFLFPKTLKIKTLNFEKVNIKKKNVLNGGFSDRRDHELCLNFTII